MNSTFVDHYFMKSKCIDYVVSVSKTVKLNQLIVMFVLH